MENETIKNLEMLNKLVSDELNRMREESIRFEKRFNHIVSMLVRQIEANNTIKGAINEHYR